MYHDVRPHAVNGIERWTVTPGRLREQIEVFLARGFVATSLEHAEANPTDTRDYVCLTFDDAFAAFTEHAYPVLDDLAIPATVFAPTQFVGGRASWLSEDAGRLAILSWDELRDLTQRGIEVGAHGDTHRALDRLSRADLTRDLEHSRSEVSAAVGHCDRMAYPFGEHSRTVRQTALAAGFRAAYAISELPIVASVDRAAMPRLTAWGQLTGDELVERARERAAGVARLAQMIRIQGYRASRRLLSRPGTGRLEPDGRAASS